MDRIWTILPEARLVGGSVRDLLRHVPLNDLDLATPEPPERVQELLEAAGIRVIPTGMDHGTVTALISHVPYEITTLRRDEETDGRHAVVAWTGNWEEDAARRDFTINAMSLDRHDVLHDYFHGMEDLKAHRVRFVGMPAQRVREDALRALRFFRFDARYGQGVPDPEACAAISASLDLVRALSAERVAQEILKILAGPRLLETLAGMEAVGLLQALLPQPDRSSLVRLLACNAPVDPLMRLFALCTSCSRVAGERLKLSKADRNRLAVFSQDTPVLHPALTDDDLRRTLAVQTHAKLIDRSWLAQAQAVARPDVDWDRLRLRLRRMPRPDFPLSGQDALAQGLRPGPAMGDWLKKGRTWWLEQGCRPDREACIGYLARHG
ncbi:poly(A) polymerase/t-RNA nucleotidyltransferase [Gluconobacter morbifer G707]|uniref:Poly(A) polymerase/t-RNA nucleotidyltransferase n=1 Tax=Gluconobacter morbifer G707 TaxID=1088869 RepID=G6XLG9_9PROT|nr:poly(A) polymerase/t-RNA nucleotidyltransferase [Gluconobacter morbifer G707]